MDNEVKGHPLAVVAAVSALVLPVTYGMSIGPAIWLQSHAFIHPDTTRLLFAPLIWLCYYIEPLNNLANWYIDLWRYI